MKKNKPSTAHKLENKVYKQMKSSEKADKKVHKDISKIMKHEKHESKKHEKSEHKAEKKEGSKLKKEVKAGKKELKIKKVMHEFKEGKLHSGSKKGPEVNNPKQAIAIALSESRKYSRKK